MKGRRYTHLIRDMALFLCATGGGRTTEAIEHDVSGASSSSAAQGSSSSSSSNKNDLHCEAQSDGSIVCQFTLPKKKSQEYLLNTCLDDDDFCVKAQVVGLLVEKKKNNHVAGIQQQKDPADAASITIGDTVYRKPYLQYGNNVARILQRYHRSSSSWPRSPYDEADWYVELGIAHRNALEEQVIMDSNAGDAADAETAISANDHVSRAVNALLQAASIYERIPQEEEEEDHIDDTEETKRFAASHLASVYFHIAEVYGLSPDVKAHTVKSLYFAKQAEALYRAVLNDATGDRPLDHAERVDLEISWAHALTRLGVLLLSVEAAEEQRAELEMLLQQQTLNQLLENPQQAAEQILGQGRKKVVESAEKARSCFEDAIDVFRRALANEKDPQQKLQLQRDLATAVQNLATAVNLLGNLPEATEHGEQALSIYQTIVDRLPKGSVEEQDALVAVAELLRSLSDIYLTMGKFDRAKERFRQSMQWHRQHDVSPARATTAEGILLPEGEQETIEAYEKALEEYKELVTDGAVDVDIPNDAGEDLEEELFAARDDGYEGDLHANLGSVYMAMGDVLQAASHLSQAIQLYKRSGEQESEAMAAVKFNMAMVKYISGEFEESTELYEAALDIWKKEIGEGNNPLAQGNEGVRRGKVVFSSQEAELLTKKDAAVASKESDETTKGTEKYNKHNANEIKEPMVDLMSDYREALQNATQDEL